MNKNRIIACLVLILAVALLSSCGSVAGTKMTMEMEMTESYDDNDPFVNEKLIYVSKDTDTLDLDIAFEMKGESGLLEIADNETGEILWSSNTWTGSTKINTFTVTLDNLEAEKEYVIRFTGTKITYAKIVITSENSLVKERAKPQKSSK